MENALLTVAAYLGGSMVEADSIFIKLRAALARWQRYDDSTIGLKIVVAITVTISITCDHTVSLPVIISVRAVAMDCIVFVSVTTITHESLHAAW